MLIDVQVGQNGINFSPANELEEIIQNVITICSTVKGTVPLDREFGVSEAVVDEPVNVARAKVSAQFIDAVRRFEPRCDVAKVSFRQDEGDEVLPVITLKV